MKGITLLVSGIMIIAMLSMVSAVSLEKVAPEGNGNSGAIWTTRNDCGNTTQDANQYNIGESIYINGAGFDADEYEWAITGKPGGASCDPGIMVATANMTVNETGAFCFNAYTIQPGDCGEYQVKFENKGDNYRVIPEFGFFIGTITILIAISLLFIIRKK